MKITVYTTTDCQFSKQEKEYLTTNNLPYEEKNLETNKDFLTEMLAVGNNFAGTPVTRVEKDDGTIAVLKGFTKEEFDTTLGLSPTTSPDEASAKAGPTSVNESASAQATADKEPKPVEATPPPMPAMETPPVVETPPPVEIPTVTPPATPPVEAAPPTPPPTTTPDLNQELGSVLDKLQQETNTPTPPPGAPSIPDFPADSATQPVK